MIDQFNNDKKFSTSIFCPTIMYPVGQSDEIVVGRKIDVKEKINTNYSVDDHNARITALVFQRITMYLKTKLHNAKYFLKKWNKHRDLFFSKAITFESFKRWTTIEIIDKMNKQNFFDSVEWMGIEHYCAKACNFLTHDCIKKNPSSESLTSLTKKAKIICDDINKKSTIVTNYITQISNHIKTTTKQIEAKLNEQVLYVNLNIDMNAKTNCDQSPETKKIIIEITEMIQYMIEDHIELFDTLHYMWEKLFCDL